MYYLEFKKLGIDCPNWTHGQKKVSCPECEKRKGGKKNYNLSLNYDDGLYKCHSSKCDFEGSVQKQKYKRKSKQQRYNRPNWESSHDYPDWFVRRMEDRGLSLKTIKKLDIRVSKGGWIEFPYFRNGEVINIKKKRKKKGHKKEFRQHAGAEKILYNLDSLKNEDGEYKDKAIIVEGELDVAAFIEAGLSKEYGIVSVDQGAGKVGQDLTGKLKCLENCAEEIDQIDEWYIAGDEDEEGQGQYLRDELIRRIGPYKCRVVKLPEVCKDPNEVLYPNKVGLEHSVCCETLRIIVRKAKHAPMPGIQYLDDDVEELMMKAFHNGREGGATTHIPKLDKHFTWFPGFLTMVSGVPNHGKGEWIRNIAMLKSIHDDWKWAFYAPEDTPVDIFYELLCRVYLGVQIDKLKKQDDGEQKFLDAIDFVRNHFFLIDPEVDYHKGDIELPTNDWVSDRIKFLKLKFGVNAYVKDPWNNMLHIKERGEREDEYLARVLSKEVYFARLFDAAVIVNHPKTMFKNKNGEYPVVDKYDINGGAMWYNKVHVFMVVDRPNMHKEENDPFTDIHLHKVKLQQLVGRPGAASMYFDIVENRYKQREGDYDPFLKTYSKEQVDLSVEDDGELRIENKSLEEDEDLPF